MALTPVGLTPVGVLSFNGHTWDATAKVLPRVEYRRDSAGRTITAQVVTLDVDSILALATDADVQAKRVALGRQGGALRYTGCGFGLNVNTGEAGSVEDIAFGPVPEILEFEPLGALATGEGTHRIKWRVTTTIPNCLGSSLQVFIEFTYSIAETISESGFRVRRISGSYTIPLGRYSTEGGSSRVIADRASNYREIAISNFPVSPNWKRAQDFDLSLDHATESFSITDTEIDSPRAYPPNVVAINSSHRIGWALRDPLAKNRLTAAITMAPGYGTRAALEVYRHIVNQRLGAALDFAGKTGGCLLVDSIDTDESLFSQTGVFSISYRISGNPERTEKGENSQDKPDKPESDRKVLLGSEFLIASAFGSPINGLSWRAWADSMFAGGKGPYSPRGVHDNFGGHIYSPPDTIVDLCYDDSSFRGFSTFRPEPVGTNKGGLSAFEPTIPKAAASWLHYQHSWSELNRVYDSTTVIELAKQEQQRKPNRDGSAGGPVVDRYSSPIVGDESRIKRTLTRGAGQLWLLEGRGERVAFKLPRLPASIFLRDEKATLSLLGGTVTQRVDTSPFGVRVHAGVFSGIYISNKELENGPPSFCYP
jgi:hypothetical protein